MEKLAKDILKNAKNHLILENNNINEVQLARVIIKQSKTKTHGLVVNFARNKNIKIKLKIVY